jgi:transposase
MKQYHEGESPMGSTAKRVEKPRIGIFGIGLQAYWDQFASLHERLTGYLHLIEERLGQWGDVVSGGMVDTYEAARGAGFTKKRYKGLDQAPTYGSPAMQYTYGRDYSFKSEQHVSLTTLEGRITLTYQGYDRHVVLLQNGATLGDAKLWYDQPKKQFYLLVSLEIEATDPTFESHKEVIGVDVGIRYLAVTSTSTGEPTFYSGKQVSNTANHYARLRKRLQQKGTRGSTRRLRRIEQRERRLKQQANHRISKHIVTTHPQALIGLEQLTDIRERTKRRKRRRKKKGNGTEPVSIQARKANRVYSHWSFAELQSMIAYKAVLSSSMVVSVDANYTSKSCPKCGCTSDKNRPNKGLLFRCQNCHYELHADLVGARNITMRTLLLRQDWGKTGLLSVVPDASDKEAKAARLQRYAELRWSPDASPSHSMGRGD